MPIIITDGIENECINHLSFYKDQNYVKQKILQNYPHLSEKKQTKVSQEIKSQITQALDFYETTNNNIRTAPLTLFYSLYNFAKAIFCINKPNLTLISGHGLVFDNEVARTTSEIAELSAVVTKGVFKNLLEVTGDQIEVGDRVICKEITSVIPELCDVYSRRYQQESNVFLLRAHKNEPAFYDILTQTVDPHGLTGKDLSIIAESGLHVFMEENKNCRGGMIGVSEACSEELFEKVTYKDVFGNTYLTCGISINNERFKASKLMALYVCYYLFSMLVRYYPEKWMVICEKEDAAIIRKLVIGMRREMLVEVLQLLSGEKYTFASELHPQESKTSTRELLEDMRKEINRQRLCAGKPPLDL